MFDDDDDKMPPKRGGNALEEFLNIDPAPAEKIEYPVKAPSKHETYDHKDEELEEDMQKIFQKAMTGYSSLEEIMLSVEPKYRARLAEVALGYLNAGLNAVNSKTKHKEHKDKLASKVSKNGTPNTVNNTQIVFSGDTNEAIRMAKNALKNAETIEGEVHQVKDSDTD